MEPSSDPVFHLKLINLQANPNEVGTRPLTLANLTSSEAPLLARMADFMIRTYRGDTIFSCEEPYLTFAGVTPAIDEHVIGKCNSSHFVVDGKLFTLGDPRWDFVDGTPVLLDRGLGPSWTETDWNAIYQDLHVQGYEVDGWPSHNPLQRAKTAAGRMEPGKHFDQRTP